MSLGSCLAQVEWRSNELAAAKLHFAHQHLVVLGLHMTGVLGCFGAVSEHSGAMSSIISSFLGCVGRLNCLEVF